jgi:hypothetical protein
MIGQSQPASAPAASASIEPPSPPVASTVPDAPLEIGGRDGPDPTRYGDWEKNGRCIDF